MSDITPSNRSFWQTVIGPHPAIKGHVEQQRTRTLAGIALTVLIGSLAPTGYIVLILRAARGFYGLLFLALFVIVYAISRTRWANWGSLLLVVGTAALDFVLMATTNELDVVTTVTTFVLLPILFATVLLDARATLVFTLLVAIGLGAYYALEGWLSFPEVIMPFLATLLVSTLAAVTAFLRERDVAIIRQQQSTLDRHSQSLENQVDQQTRNIVATAEIGRIVAGARDLDTMLKQVVSLITERFNYYSAQVFLLDDAGKQAALKAGSGAAGDELLTQGYRLPVGSQSVVGQVTATGNSVVVADTDNDPIHHRNEHLPHARSEIGLPLRVSGRVIGALNIQSTTPGAFQTSDVTVFQTIADQLGVAIENARLFERAQRDLQDIETLNRQLTGDAWRKYLTGRTEGLPAGFAASPDGVKSVESAAPGDAEGTPEGTISVPLKVRGETIGVLDVTPRSGQAPDEQMKNMLEAVAERVALALDSTRVGEQAQRQAEREQILSSISAALQATTDLNVILRVVAKETSRALSAPGSFVHLAMTYDDEPKLPESHED